MFLFGIRLDPERAGIKATDLDFIESDKVGASEEGNIF